MRRYYIRTNFKLMYWIYVAALKLVDYRLDISYSHIKRELDERLLSVQVIKPSYLIGKWSKEIRIDVSRSYILKEPIQIPRTYK